MARVNEIVTINISRETRGVSRQGFGTPLFIGTTGFGTDERVRTYSSVTQAEEDFAEGDPELVALRRYFGQQVSPTFVKVGYHDTAAVASVTYEVTAGGTEYAVTVDGTVVSFTASMGATVQEIVDGLEQAYRDAAIDGRFVDNSDGTFTLIPADFNNFTYSTATTELTETENIETYADAYGYIKSQDDDFYFVNAETHEPTDVEALAEIVEAEKRIYVTSTSAAQAKNPLVTSDIGSVLQAKDLARTVLIFAQDDTEYPECAIVGLQAPKDPGSTTWKFKSVSGVTVSRLSTTESLTLKGTRFDYGKGYNTYESIGGRNIFAEGRVANGEFIDIIRFADWLEARMRERIYLTLVNSEKIPYTSAGFAIIEGRMREVLNEGVAVGGLASYTVNVPNPRALDPNLRANRVAEGFSFEGILAGAVHFVDVQGRLTI